MTKTFKQLREINLNTALLKPRADQIRKTATSAKWTGQDKKDFETAAKFLDKGDLKGFSKFLQTLDTFPKDEILHSAGLWNTKLPESMSYVGKNVSQKLSYDNWLKKVKGIEKGAHGIKGDEHTKLSKQWRDYKKENNIKEELAKVKLNEVVLDVDYSRNPPALVKAINTMGKRLNLTLMGAPSGVEDLKKKGKARLQGGVKDITAFVEYLYKNGIMPEYKLVKEEVVEACWTGYKQVGMKMKNGKEVPNCVPDPDNKIPKQKKEETELDEGYENNMITHLGELGIDVSFRLGKMIVHKSDLQRVKDALEDGIADRGSVIAYHRMPQIKVMGEELELEEGRMKELHTLIQQGKSAEEIAKIMKLDVKTIKSLMPKEEVNEVSPPGWGGSVKAMKKHAGIDNPYALAWHMKNKGDKPHYKDKDGTPVKKDKYKDEQMEQVTEDKGYTDQQIKQAYGILNDPRYKGGNYSGAHKAIEKIAKGLASHPDVANALKRANESLDEALEVKWDADKEGWFDKQGKRRYLGKGATNTLMHKAIDKAKKTGDWVKSFDLTHGQKPEEKEIDMKKVSLKKAQYESNKYFDTKPGSIEASILKMKELEEAEVTINKKAVDDLVKQYLAKGGTITKLPPVLAPVEPGEKPPKEWDLVKGKSVPGSNQGQIAYKVKKTGNTWKILKAQLREFIRIYNEHFLTNYMAEEFIVEQQFQGRVPTVKDPFGDRLQKVFHKSKWSFSTSNIQLAYIGNYKGKSIDFAAKDILQRITDTLKKQGINQSKAPDLKYVKDAIKDVSEDMQHGYDSQGKSLAPVAASKKHKKEELSSAQKKLPPALQKAIAKKQGDKEEGAMKRGSNLDTFRPKPKDK